MKRDDTESNTFGRIFYTITPIRQSPPIKLSHQTRALAKNLEKQQKNISLKSKWHNGTWDERFSCINDIIPLLEFMTSDILDFKCSIESGTPLPVLGQVKLDIMRSELSVDEFIEKARYYIFWEEFPFLNLDIHGAESGLAALMHSLDIFKSGSKSIIKPFDQYEDWNEKASICLDLSRRLAEVSNKMKFLDPIIEYDPLSDANLCLLFSREISPLGPCLLEKAKLGLFRTEVISACDKFSSKIHSNFHFSPYTIYSRRRFRRLLLSYMDLKVSSGELQKITKNGKIFFVGVEQ